MDVRFRIDWGYQRLYSRRHYHPVCVWDGELRLDGGRMLAVEQLDYPNFWYGPLQSPRRTPLPEARWTSRTRRGIAGAAVAAEVGDDAAFTLDTASGVFRFTARELLRDGRLVFDVPGEEGLATVIVTRESHYWFRPAPAPDRQEWLPGDFALPREDWARQDQAILAPGASVALRLRLPPPPDGADVDARLQFHVQAMLTGAARNADGTEPVAAGDVTLTFAYDGGAASATHYFRYHDQYAQLLEDVWATLPAGAAPTSVTLSHSHPTLPLRLARVTARWRVRRHLETSLPPWALAGEHLVGRVYAVRPDRTEVAWPGGSAALTLVPGWNDFTFSLRDPAAAPAVTVNGRAIAAGPVFDVADETREVKVGYDLTTIPHDDHGLLDYLLDYTGRTRLGNFVAFRSFRESSPDDEHVTPEQVRRWIRICLRHRLYMQWTNAYRAPLPVGEGGEYAHNAGPHEYSGGVYARDPDGETRDMRHAAERYVASLKAEADRIHALGLRAGTGDASGGCRYVLAAGFDFVRSETHVGPTTPLCAMARAAAGAYGRPEWGVHIAIQHAKQPYLESHLGEYYCALAQPWIMGANVIYEEDSLFHLFKEERQGWDDALTRGKRDMTRAFFRFAKTHPRAGEPRIRIASLEGRYAAPFNGFICDTEQDPHYAVWGRYGMNDPAWGHAQPEKARQVLDVLMPGAATLPLRQRYDRRRFLFSGSPYGDFDFAPVEADPSWLARYDLLVNFGWHTMEARDHAALVEYVRGGGTLLTGVPQFSTRVDRGFLAGDDDLKLWNGGDLSELAGLRLAGPGAAFSGAWRNKLPGFELVPEGSRAPSDHAGEDGPCRVARADSAGAEPVAFDAETGAPLVWRHRLGRGEVWTLATWCYPGHEALAGLSAAYLAGLAARHRGDAWVEDASARVFWNYRPHPSRPESGTLMLLNTDWSKPGDVKEVMAHTPAGAWPLRVTERRMSLVTVLPDGLLDAGPDLPHLAWGDDGRLRAHGLFPAEVTHHRAGEPPRVITLRGNGTTVATLDA